MYSQEIKNQIPSIPKERDGIDQKNIFNKNSDAMSQTFKNIQKIYNDNSFNFLKHQTNPLYLCNNLIKKRLNKIKSNSNPANTFMYYKGKGLELDKFLQNQSNLKSSLKFFLENKNLQIKKLEKESEASILVTDHLKNSNRIKMKLYNKDVKWKYGMYSNHFSNTHDIDLLYSQINDKILCKIKDANISNSILFISNINLTKLNLTNSNLSEQSIYIQQIRDFLLCSEKDKNGCIKKWINNIANFFLKANLTKNIIWKVLEKIVHLQLDKGGNSSSEMNYNMEIESLLICESISFLENLFFSEIFEANQNLDISNVRQYVDNYLLNTFHITRESFGSPSNTDNFDFNNKIYLDCIDVYFLIRAGKYEIISSLLNGNIPLLNIKNLIEIYILNNKSIPSKNLKEVLNEDIHLESDTFKQAIFNILTKNKENPFEFLTQNPFDLVWYCFKMIKEPSNDDDNSMGNENTTTIELSEIQEIIYSQIEKADYTFEIQAITLFLSLQFDKALNKLMTNINYNIDAISICFILTQVRILFDINFELCNEFINAFNQNALNKAQDPDLIYILLLLVPPNLELLAKKFDNCSKTHILTNNDSVLSDEDQSIKKSLLNIVSSDGINQLKIYLGRLIEFSLPTDSSVQLLLEAKKYEEAISQLIMIQIQYLINSINESPDFLSILKISNPAKKVVQKFENIMKELYSLNSISSSCKSLWTELNFVDKLCDCLNSLNEEDFERTTSFCKILKIEIKEITDIERINNIVKSFSCETIFGLSIIFASLMIKDYSEVKRLKASSIYLLNPSECKKKDHLMKFINLYSAGVTRFLQLSEKYWKTKPEELGAKIIEKQQEISMLLT